MLVRWFGAAAVLSSALLGCGGPGSTNGGAGGQAQGGGGAGGLAGSGEGGGTEAGGGEEAVSCAEGQVPCNGACVGVGMSEGGCAVLAASAEGTGVGQGIAVDASHVYWIEQGFSVAIARVAKTGGAREEVHAPKSVPKSIAVDGERVYWPEEGLDEYWLRAMPKSGGAVVDLATHRRDIDDVMVDGARVFFTRLKDLSSLEVVSLGIDAHDEVVHGVSNSSFSTDLAQDAESVYWLSTSGPNEIVRADRSGAEPQVIATADFITGLVVRGGFAYYMSADTIWRVPTSGGAPTAVFSSPAATGHVLVGDEKSLYWASNWDSKGALWRVGMDGQNPTQLIRTSYQIDNVAADSSGVYVAMNTSVAGDGFIVRAGD